MQSVTRQSLEQTPYTLTAYGHCLCRQTLWGAFVFAGFGLWQAWSYLPVNLSLSIKVCSAGWAIGLFAGVGAVLTAAVSGLGLLTSLPCRRSQRIRVASAIQTLLWIPLISWTVLNEFVYSTTSEVLGPRTILLVWHNTAAVLEGAWEMGAFYLLATVAMTIVAAVLLYRLFRQSLQSDYPSNEDSISQKRPKVQRLAICVTGGLVVLAVLLAWQLQHQPSEALTTLCRSCPPLRAFNLSRFLIWDELIGQAPETFGIPVIAEETYVESMGRPRESTPNVVLILMESTPARALHCYGHLKSDISPNIDTLAKEGVLFEHCLASSSFSSGALVSLMTSLYMLRGDRFDYFNDVSFPYMSLPHALKLGGYELALFSSGNESFDNINQFYPPADFDVYFSHDTCDIKKSDCMRMDDKYAVGEFETWIKKRTDSRPFYCGFYLQSPHFNYEVPEPWFSYYQPIPPLYSNGDGILHIPPDMLPKLKNQYDNSIRYADYWVGRICDALEKVGELDHSIVVIAGDHGEAFMEHNLARHGTHTWEEMIHIPLIFYAGADVQAALPQLSPRHIHDSISGIDIVPTVVGLVGIQPHGSWQGLNVLAPNYTDKDRPIFSMTQYTRWQEVVCINKLKYIYDLSDVQEYLFDLSSDPDEQHNLAGSHPELANRMRELLSGWHMRQLTYYDPKNRPFTHYIGRYEPDPLLLDHIRMVESDIQQKKIIAKNWAPHNRSGDP